MREIKVFYDEFEKRDIDEKGRRRLVLRMRKSTSLLKPNGMTLDVGCRNGPLREYLASPASYVGLDITRKWWDGTFDLVVADATKLPFKAGSFDNVAALELVEHLFDPRTFIEEAYRVLKSDGFLVISTPNIACLLNRFKLMFGRMPSYFGIDSGHLHCFTYSSLFGLLFPLFRVTKRAYTYALFPLRRLTNVLPLSFLEMIAGLFPNLSDHILVRAERCRMQIGPSFEQRDF